MLTLSDFIFHFVSWKQAWCFDFLGFPVAEYGKFLTFFFFLQHLVALPGSYKMVFILYWIIWFLLLISVNLAEFLYCQTILVMVKNCLADKLYFISIIRRHYRKQFHVIYCGQMWLQVFSEGFICYLVIPRFVFEPRSRVALEGVNVTLLCNSSGFPPPAISWNFNGGRLPNVAKKFGDGSLTLFAVLNTDDYESNYTCRASNNATAMLIPSPFSEGTKRDAFSICGTWMNEVLWTNHTLCACARFDFSGLELFASIMSLQLSWNKNVPL